MWTLLNCVLLVNSLLACVAGATLLLGRSLPASPLVQLWHLDDCAPPCWHGIVPGETSIRETLERTAQVVELPILASNLASHPPIVMLVSLEDDARVELPARIDFDGVIVKRITMPFALTDSAEFPMLRLGDVAISYGLPTCVDPWAPHFQGWLWYYDTPAGVLQVAVLGGESLSWMQPVYYLSFGLHTSESGQETCRARPAISVGWRGLNRDSYRRRT